MSLPHLEPAPAKAAALAPALLLDTDRIGARLRAARDAFATAAPYPHVVLDDFLPEATADVLAAEIDDPRLVWQPLHHVNERKLVHGDLDRMGTTAAAVVRTLQAGPVLHDLECLTGIPDLLGDPELDGAGLHRMERGGYLNVHADALTHAKRRTWSRQLNLIVFLNRDWQDEYRGGLELWSADVQTCVRRIAPVFNRAVLFRTTPTSFHGVPEAIACPAGRTRKSLALYYFRDEAHVVRLRPTHYVPRPADSHLRRVLIHADRALLALYSLLKRYTPIDDARVARLLRHF